MYPLEGSNMDLEKTAENLGLDLEDFTSLLKLFLETTQEDLKKLDGALVEENWEQVSHIAHHIKGAATNLDLSEISGAAIDAESSARSKEKETLTAQIETIRRELALLARTIDP